MRCVTANLRLNYKLTLVMVDLSKVAILTYPSAFGASVGVTPFEFCRDRRQQKKLEPLRYRAALFARSYV